jgi:hypothetical protein
LLNYDYGIDPNETNFTLKTHIQKSTIMITDIRSIDEKYKEMYMNTMKKLEGCL